MVEDIHTVKRSLEENGFAVIDSFFDEQEVNSFLSMIESTDNASGNFRKSASLFAIRQFLKEVPGIAGFIFNQRFKSLLQGLFGEGYFVSKAIYFDKPPQSNWFVAWHQDITISVDKKGDMPGFGPWTIKENQYAVQPPLPILQDNFTVRIHLDGTTHDNGALKVVPQSHLKGIIKMGEADISGMPQQTCPVTKGGIMFMKPLLLHASGRTINNAQRRVIHIEFSRNPLPAGLQWSEKMAF